MTKEDISEFAQCLGDNEEPNRTFGNHKKRMEQNEIDRYDLEVMEILSDWYNEELCNLSTDNAYKKLYEAFSIVPSLKQLTKWFKENRVKRVVLLGESGSGKSAIGNCLLNLESGSGFEESKRTSSCTKEAKEIQGKLIHNETERIIAIMDTPGMNDSDDKDAENIKHIVKFLNNQEYLNCFLLVRNVNNRRMNYSFKSMLYTFELSFGEDFWKHVIIDVSHTKYVKEDEDDLNDGIEEWTQDMKNIFDIKDTQLATVGLDAKKKNHDAFKENLNKFWRLANEMPKFDCKNVKAVKSENEKYKQLEDQYKEVIKQQNYDIKQLKEELHSYKVGYDCLLSFLSH